MPAPGLPVNIDSTYADSADASVKLHQQHHDEVHKVVNLVDDATPVASGSVPVWNGSLLLARILTAADAKKKIELVNVTGAKTVDITTTTVKVYTLTGNTTFTFTGAPTGGDAGQTGEFVMVLKQDGVGGRTVTWPASIQWAGATEPTLSTAASTVNVFYFITTDAGTTWLPFRLNMGGSLPETGARPTAVGAVPVWDNTAVAYAGRMLDARDALDNITVASVTGSLSLDVSVSTVKDLTLTVSGATLTPTGAPAGGAGGRAGQMTVVLHQDGTGSRTVIWAASVKWEAGTAPVLSTAPNAVDVITLITVDTGTKWLGFFSGKDLR